LILHILPSTMLFLLNVICVLCFTGVSSEQVLTPYTDVEVASERDRVTLSCNYSSGNTLQWYRQYPQSAPLLLVLEHMLAKTPGFLLNHDKKAKRVDLEISSAQETDSALYYCALQPTVTGNPETLYKNLTAHDKLFSFIF
uniref:Ig-like domain-containing protein n=1 Tax=Oncorhynchus kisutch TaxID=8019 RepID=A0A8C7HJR6_ONCKI